LKNLPVGIKLQLVVKGAGGSFEQTLKFGRGEKKVVMAALSHPVGADRPLASTPPLTLIPGKTVNLHVKVLPVGGSPVISVNGMSLSGEDLKVIVPLDQTLELMVERAGYRAVRREFYIDSHQLNGANDHSIEVPLEAYSYGKLSMRTTPSADALITIDGKLWSKRTPFENWQIPVGKHMVRLVNDVLGMEKNVNITVQEGRVVNVDESLEIKE
jgi:hypothetical protein